MKMIRYAQNMMQDDYTKILLFLVFILLLMSIDLITGLIQAYINKDLKSGKMSNGILKKFALFIVLIAVVPLTILLPDVISVLVIISVYTLEVVNEMISILENLTKMGIDVNIFKFIIKRLNVHNSSNKENEDLDKK